MLCIVPFVPESPRWLCKRDRWEDAEKVICGIRQLPASHDYVIHEMRRIRAEVEFEAHITGANPTVWSQLKQMTKKGIRNRIAIGLCLMM